MAKSHVDHFSINVRKFVNVLPFGEEEKKIWLEELDREGLSEYLAKQILESLPKLPRPEEQKDARRMQKTLMSITQNIRQWRLQQSLQHTKGQRR